MLSYLDIVADVLEYGKWKGNRTGVRTKVLPNVHWEHWMPSGFPLLTTKKMPFKTICVELEGFINGITSKKWYQERGCHIWDQWANPCKTAKKTRDFIYDAEPGQRDPGLDRIKQWQKEEDDLGPIYGRQWRDFGASWDADDIGVEKGADQLQNIIDTLKTNPDDRRLVCSAWNPNQLSRMALPACHLLFVITHIDGVLNLHWIQRSCDLMLGVPFNIASYAMLLELICYEVNMKAGKLSCTLCDCHIYENHIDAAKEQISREAKELSKIQIYDDIYTRDYTKTFDIFKWTHKDVEVFDYEHNPKLTMEVAI